MGEKKVNWAVADKRIRSREITFTNEERAAMEKGLAQLPDLADDIEIVDENQPAVGFPSSEDDAAKQEQDGDTATPPTTGGESSG